MSSDEQLWVIVRPLMVAASLSLICQTVWYWVSVQTGSSRRSRPRRWSRRRRWRGVGWSPRNCWRSPASSCQIPAWRSAPPGSSSHRSDLHGELVVSTREALVCTLWMVRVFTCEELFGHPFGHQVQVQQRRQDSLQIAEHRGQPQTEEHDEEEHGPHLWPRHLDHSLREHDERQTRSWSTLGKREPSESFTWHTHIFRFDKYSAVSSSAHDQL